jgi:hypothetical protein
MFPKVEDFMDAHEKLLHLPLQDKQDREVIRVLLECPESH